MSLGWVLLLVVSPVLVLGLVLIVLVLRKPTTKQVLLMKREERKMVETIKLEVGKEYRLVIAGEKPVPDFRVGDVFDWTDSHRTSIGNPTPKGARVVTQVNSNSVDFVIADSGRKDRVGFKMLKRDVKFIKRERNTIFSR